MEEITLDIIENGMDGEGIAKNLGKVFFVDGAVQGEKILATITKENKNYSRCVIKEILTKSPYRCISRCGCK